MILVHFFKILAELLFLFSIAGRLISFRKAFVNLLAYAGGLGVWVTYSFYHPLYKPSPFIADEANENL